MARQDLEAKIRALRAELAELEEKLDQLNANEQHQKTPEHLPMLLEEYRRYGRQMILPGIGLPGQLKLKKSRVLVVGAGGLGCPLLMYLAGAGIGHISIVDDDSVELSNLHRQVLHSQNRLGMSKVESAKQGIRSINPTIDVQTIEGRFNMNLLEQTKGDGRLDLGDFDLLADCTDNPATRYMLSDLAVKHDLTLVSGGAVGLEGWVGVWNLPAPTSQSTSSNTDDPSVPAAAGTGSNNRGPCLRCIYPRNTNSNSGNCEDDGILGTVVGTIGVLMANEALKLLLGLHELKPSMTLFTPMSSPMFRTVRLRGRKVRCPGCDPAEMESSTRNIDSAESGPLCGTDEVQNDSRISAAQLQRIIAGGRPHTIIDTRPAVEFGICAIPGSINIPHSEIVRDPSIIQALSTSLQDTYLVCRRGNDSLLDSRIMRQSRGTESGSNTTFKGDLRGGIQAWHQIHPDFPLY